jgi:hypothetical protein
MVIQEWEEWVLIPIKYLESFLGEIWEEDFLWVVVPKEVVLRALHSHLGEYFSI